MEAPSQEELNSMQAAASEGSKSDSVVRWQSAYGLIIIETRGHDVFVNGKLVMPAGSGLKVPQ